ncbi:MAG: hypothetical protein VB021_04200 [Oscillospiraceae bacterium]|nr:hypothetical protein [Oscillospiraceae bacterium]
MKLIVDDELKIAGFWLSRAERDDGELKASLKPQFAEWKAKNYLPVVYESGDGDLKESIYYLLKHHIEKKAKAEVEAERNLTMAGIDCGSGYPDVGRLACLRLDDMKEFYSE